MKTAIIIMARKGSGKHRAIVGGRPICDYPLEAASCVPLESFVFTDDPGVQQRAATFRIPALPREPSPDDQLQSAGIQEACFRLLDHGYNREDGIIIMLGNSPTVTPQLIEEAAAILRERDSCVTAVQMPECHPTRALLKGNNEVMSLIPPDGTCNRQDLQPVFFYDYGIWGTKIGIALENDGPSQWSWLSHDCEIIERKNPFHFDYHNKDERLAMETIIAFNNQQKRQSHPCE